MKLVFDQMEEIVRDGFKGGKGKLRSRMHLDQDNKITRGILAPGAFIGQHTHEGNSEIIYILAGTGKVLCDGEYETLAAGDCHYCPQGHTHSLINDSEQDLLFLAVVPEHK